VAEHLRKQKKSQFNRLYIKKNSPFNASITFRAAVEILEFTLDGVLLTDGLLRELHVAGVFRVREFPRPAMITISLDYVN
jgi:hypothetical protein